MFQMTGAEVDGVVCHRLGGVPTTECPRGGKYGLPGPKYRLGGDG